MIIPAKVGNERKSFYIIFNFSSIHLYTNMSVSHIFIIFVSHDTFKFVAAKSDAAAILGQCFFEAQ